MERTLPVTADKVAFSLRNNLVYPFAPRPGEPSLAIGNKAGHNTKLYKVFTAPVAQAVEVVTLEEPVAQAAEVTKRWTARDDEKEKPSVDQAPPGQQSDLKATGKRDAEGGEKTENGGPGARDGEEKKPSAIQVTEFGSSGESSGGDDDVLDPSEDETGFSVDPVISDEEDFEPDLPELAVPKPPDIDETGDDEEGGGAGTPVDISFDPEIADPDELVPDLPPLDIPFLGAGLEGSEEPEVPELPPLELPVLGGGLEESEEPSVPDFPASVTSDPDLSDPTSLVPDLPPLQLPSFGGGGLEESEEPGVSDIPEVVESPALPSFFSGFGPEISDTEEAELDLPELDFAPDSVLDFAESIDTVPGFPGE
ncbi:hypothetical protein BSKO_12222 [Bryopsis sp. KO-2023]|nr:hypothetical protein BSKO_12222 [Bryopsis sp. KO-2023]